MPLEVGVLVELVFERLGWAGEGKGVGDAALLIRHCCRLSIAGCLDVLQSHIVSEQAHGLVAALHRHAVDLRLG